MDTKQRKRPAAPAGKEPKMKRAPTQKRQRPRGAAEQSGRTRSTAAVREKKPQAQRVRSAERTQKPQRLARTAVQRRRAVEPQSVQERPAAPAPEIVYTPPRPFNRNRLLLQLLSVAAVAVAMVLGVSIFFKVDADKIMVSGAQKYDAYIIREASGIKDGDNLLTFGQAKASGKITTALPYVKDVRIGIKLPDTVHIEVTEYDVVYSIQDSANGWWLITAGGKVIEQVDNAKAGENTTITGVKLLSPRVQGQAVAADSHKTQKQTEAASEEAEDATEAAPAVTVPVATVSAEQQLRIALDILQAMEKNSVIGTVASVDVTDTANLQLWYEDRYQIMLGDGSDLEYKILCMRKAVEQLESYQRGILDVSFTTWPDQVAYTPFS